MTPCGEQYTEVELPESDQDLWVAVNGQRHTARTWLCYREVGHAGSHVNMLGSPVVVWDDDDCFTIVGSEAVVVTEGLRELADLNDS